MLGRPPPEVPLQRGALVEMGWIRGAESDAWSDWTKRCSSAQELGARTGCPERRPETGWDPCPLVPSAWSLRRINADN